MSLEQALRSAKIETIENRVQFSSHKFLFATESRLTKDVDPI